MTLTLFYLDNSRAFRVLWTAYELGLGSRIKVKTFPRIQGKKADASMTSESGFSLGKSPFLVDDEGGQRIEVFESVACMEYLIERYGGSNQTSLIPSSSDWAARTRVTSLMSFCETFMLHSLAIIYARWHLPTTSAGPDVLPALEEKMSANVQKDFDLLEKTLQENVQKYGKQDGLYLANGNFSAADIANAFSAEYILDFKAGTADKKWPNVEAWLRNIEGRPAYQETKRNAGKHDFTLTEKL